MPTRERLDIVTLDQTKDYYFRDDSERVGDITAKKATRETILGMGITAVLQEEINPNGSPNGSYVISTIDRSCTPPKVLSVSVGSELGVQACTTHNPDVATDIQARQQETWFGHATPTGRNIVAHTIQVLNAPLYQQ